MKITDPLPYVRDLKIGDKGPAVEAFARAIYRFLDDGAEWTAFNKQSQTRRRTFTAALRSDLIRVQGILRVGNLGRLDRETLDALVAAGAFDLLARHLWMEEFRPAPTLVYPYPIGEGGGVCQGLHPTAGLIGNWAIDFCDTPGARVLSPEAGTIQRLSGHPPGDDTADAAGVFGYNTYVRTPHGYVYFITHLGWQNPHCRVGTKVLAGTVLGKVGDQHFRPDHCHVGVTSPLGIADAKRRITAVSKAARVHAVTP